ncbi:MAG: hypothetical protein PF517_18585 [Salinivirgaceae bacterium]|jgi:hypothetical protein|nr:hypothetical protein [Salinivirgaceae bacterium]
MKQVIIGIHGLGNKPPKYLLKKWWKDAILEGFSHQNIKTILPEFELVYWADLLYDKPLDKWEKNTDSPYFLDEPYEKAKGKFVPEDHSLRIRVIDFISRQLNKIFLNDDRTLNYGYLSDRILKRYFHDLDVYYFEEHKDEFDTTYKARKLIRKRMVDTLFKYKDYEILIVAHSMGSIVTFDVLSFVMPEAKINTLITIGSPLGLPVVVSKIASEHKKIFHDNHLLITPHSINKRWINMADILDRVALNYKLSDDFTPNTNGILPIDYLVNNNYKINGERNPHKSFGYLRTPEFTRILHEFISERKLTNAEKLLKKLNAIFNKVLEEYSLIKDKFNLN